MKKNHPIQILAGQYPQLCLPIMTDARNTPEYQDSVLRGLPVNREPDFSFSDEDELKKESTPVGDIEVLFLAVREDFIHAYRALAYRCEPAEIPDSVGAGIVSGLINWKKIHDHMDAFQADDEEAWDAEFSLFTSVKSNYLDSIILLSSGNYSNIPAGMVGLGEKEWKEKSFIIRKYHEMTHFICRTLYPEDIEPIRDEVIADMVGLLKAFGEYDTDLARTFFGIEGESFREGGRLAHYTKDDEDISTVMARTKGLIAEYAEKIRGREQEDVFSLLVSLF